MASHFDINPSVNSGTEETDCRRAPIIIQILPNAGRQLRKMTNDMETFIFGLSFYNRLDKEEERQRRADNSDYLPGSHHSPDQDYHNSQDSRDRRDHGLKSSDNLFREITPNSADDNEQRLCKLKESLYENRDEREKFDQEVFDTLRQVDAYVIDKQRSLEAVADTEQSLRAECEKMRKENEKLNHLQSVNVTFHRDVTTKLDKDLQSMTSAQNELLQKLRVSKFQSDLDREEFKKQLQVANQRKVATHNEEEYNSFTHRNGQIHSNPKTEDNFRTGHHMELETVHHVQNPIITSSEYELNAVHLLRPETGNAMGTVTVNNTIPIQQAVKLPVFSTHYVDIDGNKTF